MFPSSESKEMVTLLAEKLKSDNAPELLEKQLSRRAKKGEYGIIALSSATEPYMPIEKKLRLTRRLIKPEHQNL